MAKAKRLSFFVVTLLALLGIYFVASSAILSGNIALTGALVQSPLPGGDEGGTGTNMPPPPPTDVGSLNVTSIPSGTSIYDGTNYMGLTPFILQGMTVGNHNIKLTKQGYQDYTVTVNIQKNVASDLSVVLVPLQVTNNTSNIYVTSSPSVAFVYLNGVYKGTTPLSISGLIPSSYTLKVEKSGYYDYVTTVSASAGTTVNVFANLTQRSGNLNISTMPTGAQIYVDSAYKGTSPVYVTGVGTGSRSIIATKDPYGSKITSAYVYENQTTYVNILFETEPPPYDNTTYYTLSVSKTGTGSGEINSGPDSVNGPAAIKCGSDCSESYADGTSVTIYAFPSAGSVFSGWGGACSGISTSCTVLMNSNKNAVANFTSNASGGGGGGGGGTVSPTGIIVYTSRYYNYTTNSFDNSVYAMDVTNNGTRVGEARRILIGSNTKRFSNLSLSHDGKRLLFIVNNYSQDKGIYLINLNCPEPTCTPQQILPAGSIYPQWSKDDSQILYLNTTEYQKIMIYTVSTGANKLIYGINHPMTDKYSSLTWSNNGNNITFANRTIYTISKECNGNPWTCPLLQVYSSSGPLKVRGFDGGANLTFSLLYTSGSYEIPYNGGRAARLIHSGAWYPILSPNGQSVLTACCNTIYPPDSVKSINSDCTGTCNIRDIANSVYPGVYDWKESVEGLSEGTPSYTVPSSSPEVSETEPTAGPTSPATSSTITETASKIDSAANSIQDPAKKLEVESTTTRIKETVQQISKLENEQTQRGYGYGFGWFFGFAADQEKKDAAFMILQATKLRTSSKTLLRVSETLTEPAKSIVAEQAKLLEAQANDLLKKADAKKKNAAGILSFLIG